MAIPGLTAMMAVVIAVETAVLAIAVITIGVAAAIVVVSSIEVMAPLRSVAIRAVPSCDVSTCPVAGKSRSAEAAPRRGVAADQQAGCPGSNGDNDTSFGEHRRPNFE